MALHHGLPERESGGQRGEHERQARRPRSVGTVRLPRKSASPSFIAVFASTPTAIAVAATAGETVRATTPGHRCGKGVHVREPQNRRGRDDAGRSPPFTRDEHHHEHDLKEHGHW